jgi:hypothetical protein
MNNIGHRIFVVNENANVSKYREIWGVHGGDFSLFLVLLNTSSQIPELSHKLGNDHFLQYTFTLIQSFDAILFKLQCC